VHPHLTDSWGCTKLHYPGKKNKITAGLETYSRQEKRAQEMILALKGKENSEERKKQTLTAEISERKEEGKTSPEERKEEKGRTLDAENRGKGCRKSLAGESSSSTNFGDKKQM